MSSNTVSRVSVHAMGGAADADLDRLRAQIKKEGMAIEPWDRRLQSGGGTFILVTKEVSPTEFAMLSSLENEGWDHILVIVSSAPMAPELQWEMIAKGATDVILWNETTTLVADIMARLQRWRVVDNLLADPVVRDNLIGESQCWRACLRELIEVGRFSDSPVLLMGECGTGKELAARLIHTIHEDGPDRPLIIVDCGTLVPELSGSELFGHVRGAYTGADGAREGAFQLADGGTLYLDEVGELPLDLQPKLLRAIQEQTFKPLGSNSWVKSSFRLIAATNRNLVDAVNRREFRRDLYDRIASNVIELPPLRDRPRDIVPLTNHFLAKYGCLGDEPAVSSAVRSFLSCQEYEGNIRELEQLVHRIANRHVGSGPITMGDIPIDARWPNRSAQRDSLSQLLSQTAERAVASGQPLSDMTKAFSDYLVNSAIRQSQGDLGVAAKRLGVTRRALERRRAIKRKSAAEGALDLPQSDLIRRHQVSDSLSRDANRYNTPVRSDRVSH